MLARRNFSLAAALLLAVPAGAALARPARGGDPAPAPIAALERIAVIGASVSDGFLLPNEVDAMITVADVLRAAVRQPIDLPYRKSNMLFFRDPVQYGTRYVEEALAHDPTLVVGVDFLFWFGYGFTVDEESRLARLEQGLQLLARFDCPLVVGDFPDVREAARRGVGVHGAPMISEWQVPQPGTLVRLNERLAAWAKERGNVHVLKLSRFLEQVRSGAAVEVRGNHWPAGSMATLLDKDLLHTTFEGTVALALVALDLLVKEDQAFPAEAFHWDKDVVKARALEFRAAERAQRRAARGEPAEDG